MKDASFFLAFFAAFWHNENMTDYTELQDNLEAVTEDVPHLIANLANASAYIYEALPDLNWCGFYLTEGEKLVLGPFQGRAACVEIPYGKGVCGTAALKDETLLVENVHDYDGHIACDCASNSEIVVPLHDPEGTVFGVLDIDSPLFSRFTQEDRTGLEGCVRVLEKTLFGDRKA